MSRLDKETLIAMTTMNAEDASAWKNYVVIMLRFTPTIRHGFFNFSTQFGAYWDNKRWQNNKRVYEEFLVNVLNV